MKVTASACGKMGQKGKIILSFDQSFSFDSGEPFGHLQMFIISASGAHKALPSVTDYLLLRLHKQAQPTFCKRASLTKDGAANAD